MTIEDPLPEPEKMDPLGVRPKLDLANMVALVIWIQTKLAREREEKDAARKREAADGAQSGADDRR